MNHAAFIARLAAADDRLTSRVLAEMYAREVVKVMIAAIPAVNLEHVQGGTSTHVCGNASCPATGCPST